MAKVEIKQVHFTNDYDEEWSAELIYVDGELVARGTYGGEPEDNRRYRTYAWVPEAFRKLAAALGAEVVMSGKAASSAEEFEDLVY